MSIGFSYKNDEKIFTEKVENGVPYLEYPLLADTGLVRHGFSTRLGGVSEGVCSTMNLSFSRAVSYTHLDVYKRQVSYAPCYGENHCRAV